VANDQLAPALEQVEQAGPAARALELVVLVDPDHREPPTLGVECVTLAGELLFLLQQRLASEHPVAARRDLRKSHLRLLVIGCVE
jgi:hypothetical protein